ncbi:MAG: carbohydrate kinase family protein [Eubacteriaceae bacterium]|jgi:sugar/nucleoside kinase (ribokinase family)|nr:carbohydrate kinase family protein [Eubacteriaceae bacterium]
MAEEIKKRKAACAGNIGIDIIPHFTNKKAGSVADVIIPGRITHIEGSGVHPGGSPGNTGLAMNLFGIDTVICGKTGNDPFGDMLCRMLDDAGGAGTSAGIIRSDDVYTAWSVIISPAGLDRSILQNPGANDDFGFDDIDFDLLRGCSLLHFGHPPSMKKIYENSGRELVRIFSAAQEAGMLTSLDMCAVDPSSDAADCDWQEFLAEVLPYTDFFVPSIDELKYMTGAHAKEPPEMTARRARELGASNILIKCGSDGMYFENAGEAVIRSIEDRLEISTGSMDSWIGVSGSAPAKKAQKEVSGLGAGDTSIAAYLSAMLRGYDFRDCIDLALTEGALCVTAEDAVSGLLPFEELSR